MIRRGLKRVEARSDWVHSRGLIEFDPYFKNGHLATLAGNFWVRPEVGEPERIWFEAAEGVRVLVERNWGGRGSRGDLVLLHGLEGSSGSGYMRSAAARGLRDGWTVHRVNMRACGGGDAESATMYHAGLTEDLRRYVEGLAGPVVLAGFSLGANVVLKLAGEWGGGVPDAVAGVCGVSVPLDLGACVDELERRGNWLYQWKFVSRLKERVVRRHAFDAAFPIEGLEKIRTIRQFDERYVAPYFGFGTAANYYATQSCGRFVDEIRVPAMILQAKDDPMIPFRLFEGGWRNPNVELVATEHGGHLGFIARKGARFWVDEMLMVFAGRTAGVMAR